MTSDLKHRLLYLRLGSTAVIAINERIPSRAATSIGVTVSAQLNGNDRTWLDSMQVGQRPRGLKQHIAEVFVPVLAEPSPGKQRLIRSLCRSTTANTGDTERPGVVRKVVDIGPADACPLLFGRESLDDPSCRSTTTSGAEQYEPVNEVFDLGTRCTGSGHPHRPGPSPPPSSIGV
ncbi:MAG: hypothetical protein R2849_13505 [Thermomicrobiales bacterium]